MKIYVIKTNIGCFLSENFFKHYTEYSAFSGLSKLDIFVNDNKLKLTKANFSDWYFVEEFPKKLFKFKPREVKNTYYELIDESIASDLIPKTLTKEDVQEALEYCDDEDDEDDMISIWKNKKFSPLRSLYQAKNEYCDEEYIELENVEFEVIADVEDYQESLSRGFDTGKSWISPRYMKIEEILIPEPLSYKRKCYLTSEEFYKVIRAHVKKNIDVNYAVVTSDYDFCFTVKKRILLEESLEDIIECRRPKVSKNMKRKYEEFPIFEMTDDKQKYKGYPVLEGISGKNLKDLKEKVDLYLKELMTKINAPLKICECCKGTGYNLCEE